MRFVDFCVSRLFVKKRRFSYRFAPNLHQNLHQKISLKPYILKHISKNTAINFYKSNAKVLLTTSYQKHFAPCGALPLKAFCYSFSRFSCVFYKYTTRIKNKSGTLSALALYIAFPGALLMFPSFSHCLNC